MPATNVGAQKYVKYLNFYFAFQLQFHGKQKRSAYVQKLLSLAYKDVVEKGTSVCKTANMFGVPEFTLRDRTLGLQPVPTSEVFPSNPGPSPTFTNKVEKPLIRHLTYMASIGHGYSRTLATDFAVSLNKKKSTDPVFAQSWFESFKKRNPELSMQA
jgi:hypothetical protein